MLRIGIFWDLKVILILTSSYFCFIFRLNTLTRRFSCEIALRTFKLLRFVANTDCAGSGILILDVHLVVHIRWQLRMMRLAFKLRGSWLRIALRSPCSSIGLNFKLWLIRRFIRRKDSLLKSQVVSSTASYLFLRTLNIDTTETWNIEFRQIENLRNFFYWCRILCLRLGLRLICHKLRMNLFEGRLEETFDTRGIALWLFLWVLKLFTVRRFAVILWKKITHGFYFTR